MEQMEQYFLAATGSLNLDLNMEQECEGCLQKKMLEW